MTRLASLVVLVSLVLIFAALFFRVMIGFLVPLFLALLLAMLFRPLHLGLVRWFRGYDRLAAAATTITILLIVLAPTAGVLFRGAIDAAAAFEHSGAQRIDLRTLDKLINGVANQFDMTLSPEAVKEIHGTIGDKLREWVGPVVARTPGFLGRLLIGGLVMVVALYYFLADGPQMIATITALVPLDQQYQGRLVSEFEQIVRAVVAAHLLTAVAQGILAGIGFYFAGLNSIFVLVMLTMIGSFIPFVGAAAVWVGACLSLYFIDKRPLAAVLLATYGVAIVSSVDNLIKPWVLHGQSKLHPLLALLSVLGGLQALGPIGIFVGPMAVAFLQAGLQMLQTELSAMQRTGPPIGPRPILISPAGERALENQSA